jgi:hypothetical protein
VPVELRQHGFIFYQPNRKELINEKTIHFYQHGPVWPDAYGG